MPGLSTRFPTKETKDEREKEKEREGKSRIPSLSPNLTNRVRRALGKLINWIAEWASIEWLPGEFLEPEMAATE